MIQEEQQRREFEKQRQAELQHRNKCFDELEAYYRELVIKSTGKDNAETIKKLARQLKLIKQVRLDTNRPPPVYRWDNVTKRVPVANADVEVRELQAHVDLQLLDKLRIGLTLDKQLTKYCFAPVWSFVLCDVVVSLHLMFSLLWPTQPNMLEITVESATFSEAHARKLNKKVGGQASCCTKKFDANNCAVAMLRSAQPLIDWCVDSLRHRHCGIGGGPYDC